ncbi:MAG: MSHA biogenesis protein MshE, partial [Deltaproteobacteria bacterium]|nr:MSHA biogenesis protein MshE [Deltaproteobacteria bacterium]
MHEDYSRKLLGEILVEQGKLSFDNVDLVLSSQKKTGLRIGRQIVSMGFVAEEEVLKALSLQLNVPYFSNREYPTEPV